MSPLIMFAVGALAYLLGKSNDDDAPARPARPAPREAVDQARDVAVAREALDRAREATEAAAARPARPAPDPSAPSTAPTAEQVAEMARAMVEAEQRRREAAVPVVSVVPPGGTANATPAAAAAAGRQLATPAAPVVRRVPVRAAPTVLHADNHSATPAQIRAAQEFTVAQVQAEQAHRPLTREQIKGYQRRMGGVVADGRIGPQTRDRMGFLIARPGDLPASLPTNLSQGAQGAQRA